ncbi:TVP38/TMEM64 family protein [Actinokineospora iranica]|uniref:TVP38/TMEM64 family protein n=1 Tax=Actinokineospora iranica TaxID=1271860 RepID=UPI001E64B468|nr:TVP38/TMEM64 family protein [Actinokineospora iranica]
MSARATLITVTVLLAALVVAGALVPIPTPAEIRGWADGAGWATPVLFLLAYSVLTVAPIPRTVFNLSAGLLLGEFAGVLIAMIATALAATLTFALVRGLGRRWVQPHLERAALRAVNRRLSGGGLVGMISLRLIPVVPFAPVNYCCGLSTVAFRPFLLGTVIGSLPGTAAAVILGDALTGTTPPSLIAIYAALALLGGAGMVFVLRRTQPDLVEV